MTLTIDPAYLPGIQRQLLGNRTGSSDCGRRSLDWTLTWSTYGYIRPKDPVAICDRMGIKDCLDPNGKLSGSTIGEVKTGYDSYIPDALALGLKLPPMRIRNSAGLFREFDELVAHLKLGGAAALFVQYGQLEDYSGQPGLDIIHVMPICGYREDAQGRRFTISYDPLYDGRRRGIPNGPTEIPLKVIAKALGAVRQSASNPAPIGTGRGVFGTVKRASVIATPPPPPPSDLDVALERARLAEVDRDRAWAALGVIGQLGTDIEWTRLVTLAADGSPTPNTGQATAPVDEGGDASP